MVDQAVRNVVGGGGGGGGVGRGSGIIVLASGLLALLNAINHEPRLHNTFILRKYYWEE